MGMQNSTIRFPVSEKSKLTEAAECRETRKKGTGRTPSPLVWPGAALTGTAKLVPTVPVFLFTGKSFPLGEPKF